MTRTDITAERLPYGDFTYRITIVYRFLFLWWTVRYTAKRKDFGLGFWWFKEGDRAPVVQPIAFKLNIILSNKLAAKEVKPVLFTCGPPHGAHNGAEK